MLNHQCQQYEIRRLVENPGEHKKPLKLEKTQLTQKVHLLTELKENFQAGKLVKAQLVNANSDNFSLYECNLIPEERMTVEIIEMPFQIKQIILRHKGLVKKKQSCFSLEVINNFFEYSTLHTSPQYFSAEIGQNFDRITTLALVKEKKFMKIIDELPDRMFLEIIEISQEINSIFLYWKGKEEKIQNLSSYSFSLNYSFFTDYIEDSLDYKIKPYFRYKKSDIKPYILLIKPEKEKILYEELKKFHFNQTLTFVVNRRVPEKYREKIEKIVYKSWWGEENLDEFENISQITPQALYDKIILIIKNIQAY